MSLGPLCRCRNEDCYPVHMPQRTVFVVEDDPELCEVLSGEIESGGWTVFAFTNPLAALAEIDARCPDVVLVDYRLPHMMGDVFARAVRDRAPFVHVVLMSGDSRVLRLHDSSLEIDLLSKPFGIDRVLAVLDAATAQRRSA